MRLPTYADFARLRDEHVAGLAQVMGVRPWETDDLTWIDLVRLCAALSAGGADGG